MMNTSILSMLALLVAVVLFFIAAFIGGEPRNRLLYFGLASLSLGIFLTTI